MMPGAQCCVGGCSNRRGTNISLHKFPKDVELREKWVKAICFTGTSVSRSGWKPTVLGHSQLVCSEHFEYEAFTRTSRFHWEEGLTYKACLEEWATPTLFNLIV